jgi:hypothetical protein
MSRKIYLIQKGNKLQPMAEQPYLSEDRFQALLEEYPDLLAGDQINESEPRRWLLVSREVGVPDGEDAAGRWSLDHLFLDQDAIPTLVEVKRGADSRLRREVVGQMLDYAANAIVYWPIEAIRAKFEARCDSQQEDPVQLLEELIEADFDDEAAIDSFWERVKTNLKAGKIRLIFVADEIPSELRRIVEFLNTQMDPAEVLAVEIKQYVGQGVQTLVPKVMGQTAGADTKKRRGASAARQWDEASFFEELETTRGAEEAEVARRILEWANEKMPAIWWGRGAQNGGFIPGLDHKGKWRQLVEVWTYGTIEVQFQYMRKSTPFDVDANRLDLLHRLNEIPGVEIPEDALNRRPGVPLSIFSDEANLERLLGALDWAVEQILAS